MARKRKPKPVAPAAQPSQESAALKVILGEGEAEIRLLVPRLNAHRVMCPSGTVIAPDVDGWPDARVSLHLRHGHAEAMLVEGSGPSEQTEPTATE